MAHAQPALTPSHRPGEWLPHTPPRLRPLQRHGLALLILALAVGVRFALLPPGYGLAFLTLYPAALLSFYLCGAGPGSSTILLGSVAGYLIQSQSFGQLRYDGDAFLATLMYALLSGFMVLLLHRLQSTTADLREALKAHELNEENYLQILECQSDAICRFNADNTITYVNDAFCALFGVPRAQLVGHSWTPLPVGADMAHVHAELSKLSPDRPVVTTESRVNTATGVRWGQFVNSASFDANGRLTSVQSVGRDITERKELEQRLAESMASFKDFYDNAPCGYYSLDPNGTIIAANRLILSWLGLPEAEVVGRRKISDFYTLESRALFSEKFPEFMRSGRVEGLEFDLVSEDGTQRRIRLSATAIYGDDGAFVMSRTVANDITELRRNKERLRQLAVEQEAMLNNQLTGIIKVKDRRFVWVNEAMHRIFGYDIGELEGHSLRMLYPDDSTFESVGAAAYPVVLANGLYRTQSKMVHKDGHAIWIDLQGALLSGDTGETLWVISDISEIKRAQENTEQAAFTDALTGLPNRRAFAERVKQVTAMKRRSDVPVALCYLDLDGFRQVNDSHGPATGDQLLIQVAGRLKASLRAHDVLCRLDGDTFVILMCNVGSPAERDVSLQRLTGMVEKPFDLGDGLTVRVTASIGFVELPEAAGPMGFALRQSAPAGPGGWPHGVARGTPFQETVF